MKKIIIFILICFIITIMVISGCTTQKHYPNWKNNPRFDGEEKSNMSTERIEEMSEICKDKAEGDECTLTNPRGYIEGRCTLIEDKLLCMPKDMEGRSLGERPKGQPQPGDIPPQIPE